MTQSFSDQAVLNTLTSSAGEVSSANDTFSRKNLRKQLFPDASEKKRYLEILVGQHSEGYSKGSKLKFERFKQNVDLAVEQAALFCEDPDAIREELGTSVGKLIRDMRT